MLSAALLFLFSFSLIGPVLFADRDSNLPACCRRDGKHHCAMMAMLEEQESTSGPAAKAGRATCPCFPGIGTAQASSKIAVLKTSEAIFASLVRQPAVAIQTEALYRISHSRSQQKRGPPSAV